MTGDRRFGLTVAALGALFVVCVGTLVIPAAIQRNGTLLALVGIALPAALALTVLGARIATDSEGSA